jgi:hypothetical protein
LRILAPIKASDYVAVVDCINLSGGAAMFSLNCPHCQKTLKTDKVLPQNASITCPGCKQKFPLATTKVTEVPSPPTHAAPAKPNLPPISKHIGTSAAARPIAESQSLPPVITGSTTAAVILPQALPAPRVLPPPEAAGYSAPSHAAAAFPASLATPPRLLWYVGVGVFCSVLIGVGIMFAIHDDDAIPESAADPLVAAEIQQPSPAQTVRAAKTSTIPETRALSRERETQKTKFDWYDGGKCTYRFEFSLDTTDLPQLVSGTIAYSFNKARTDSLRGQQNSQPFSNTSKTPQAKPQLLVVGSTLRIERDELNAWRGFPSTFDLVIDERGELHPEYEQRGPKPLLFNGIDTLGLEYVAHPEEQNWELKRKFSGLDFWARRLRSNPNIPSGPPFPNGQFPPGPPAQFPSGQQIPGLPPGISLVDVLDHTSYRTVEKNAKTLELEKNHSMAKWQSSSSGEPQPFLQGKGTVTYDIEQQLPSASKMIYRAENHPQLGTATYTYTYQLEKTQTAAEVLADNEKRRADRKAQAEKRDQEQAEALQEILEELAGSNKDPRAVNTPYSKALTRLSAIPVNSERQEEVAMALNKFLLSENMSEIESALAAAKKWGTQANREALLHLTEMKSSSLTAGNAIELLGQLCKTSEMAERLREKHSNPLRRNYVQTAWRKIGPPAEDAALQALQQALQDDYKDLQLKENMIGAVVGVLGEIGGKKSYEVLSNYKLQEIAGVRKSVFESALQKCRKRMSAEEKATAQSPTK